MCRLNYIHFNGCDEDSPFGPPIMCQEFQANRAMLETSEDRTGRVSLGQEPHNCPGYKMVVLEDREGYCPSCQVYVLNQRQRDASKQAKLSTALGVLRNVLGTSDGPQSVGPGAASGQATGSFTSPNARSGYTRAIGDLAVDPELRAAIRQFNHHAAQFALAPFGLARYTQAEGEVVVRAGRIVEAYTQRYAQLYALARSQRSPVVTPPRPMTNLEWMGSIVAHNERVRQQAQQIPDAHPTDRRNSSPGPPISLGPIPESQRRAEQAISNAMDMLQRRPLTHLDHLR